MSETKTYRIIIAGSRDFENYEVVKTKAAAVIKAIKEKEPEAKIEIVSGGARGVDSLGERFAREYGYKLWRFPADWNVQPDRFETGKCWNLPWSKIRC